MSVLKSIKDTFKRMFGDPGYNIDEVEQSKQVVYKLRNQLRREENIRYSKHRRTRR